MMTNGDLMDMLVKRAKEYCPGAVESIIRNKHMSSVGGKTMLPSQKVIDALIVDFVNYTIAKLGGDLGLYTRDLYEERGEK